MMVGERQELEDTDDPYSRSLYYSVTAENIYCLFGMDDQIVEEERSGC